MSKQDRQGVRTPADIERKYDLGGLSTNQEANEKVSQLTQSFRQLEANLQARLNSLEKRISATHPIGSYYISIDSANPTDSLGGTWELVAQGYFVVGSEQEEPIELQFLDNCYIWMRTA